MHLPERVRFLKHEIVFEDGVPTEGSWSEFFKARGSIFYRAGSEAVIAARLEGRQPAFLRIRNCHGSRMITTDHICQLVDGSTFNIRSIYQDPKNRLYICLDLEAGVAKG